MNSDDARVWLRKNGHTKIADMIDDIMEEWKLAGKRTRRNWWDILAGGRKGKPRTVAGRKFPVLQAAQLRQKVKVTSNAVRTKTKTIAPKKLPQARWRQ